MNNIVLLLSIVVACLQGNDVAAYKIKDERQEDRIREARRVAVMAKKTIGRERLDKNSNDERFIGESGFFKVLCTIENNVKDKHYLTQDSVDAQVDNFLKFFDHSSALAVIENKVKALPTITTSVQVDAKIAEAKKRLDNASVIEALKNEIAELETLVAAMKPSRAKS